LKSCRRGTADPAAAPADPALQARLRALAALRRPGQRASYVDYAQAEQDAERLAALLLKAYSGEALNAFSFAAIPRGGYIILGMLSYLLDLEHRQLQPDAGAGPLVIVDDCALTGARFGAFLRGRKNPRAVFAHLYSHPGLRRAILAREPRVEACLAARDLQADAPRENPGDPPEPPAASDVWRARLGPDRYWWGAVPPIGFAWSEPDSLIWNPAAGRVEDGWQLLPPHLCLKNRARLGMPPRRQPAALPTWRAPASVAAATFDGVLWLCCRDRGEIVTLEGVAADMWRALAVYGDLRSAVSHLSTLYAVDGPRLVADLEAFAGDLAAHGLLEPCEAAGDPAPVPADACPSSPAAP
jgi:hypothetical protein